MNTALLSLLQLSDPALPIGGYAHSGGLETYVQEGLIRDAAAAGRFIEEMLRTSLFYTDAALVALAHDAAQKPAQEPTQEPAPKPAQISAEKPVQEPAQIPAQEPAEKPAETLRDLDDLCEAVKIPREMREASRKLGSRLLKIFNRSAIEKPGITHYPVAFGYCAARLNIGKCETLTGFYYNAAAGMVTNCVKLIPIGQQEGQEILLSLHRLIAELAEKSLNPDKDLIGRCCTALDIRCMQHEQLYSRLYMS